MALGGVIRHYDFIYVLHERIRATSGLITRFAPISEASLTRNVAVLQFVGPCTKLARAGFGQRFQF